MAYPRRQLADGERVELELHPHVRALCWPTLVLLVVVPVASYQAARVPPGSPQLPWRVAIGVLALLVLTVLTVLPFLRWVSTDYVVTDRRLITRRGVLGRTGRDVPLSRVSDISFSHGLLQRLLGCGTLVVESSGGRGQLVLTDVPGVDRVQRLLHELAEPWAPGGAEDDDGPDDGHWSDDEDGFDDEDEFDDDGSDDDGHHRPGVG